MCFPVWRRRAFDESLKIRRGVVPILWFREARAFLRFAPLPLSRGVVYLIEESAARFALRWRRSFRLHFFAVRPMSAAGFLFPCLFACRELLPIFSCCCCQACRDIFSNVPCHHSRCCMRQLERVNRICTCHCPGGRVMRSVSRYEPSSP